MTDKYEALKAAAQAVQGASSYSSKQMDYEKLAHPAVVLELLAERDALAEKLAELQQQEPAYLLTPDGKCYAHGSMPPLSAGYADATLLNLYLAPGANPDTKDAELLDWLGQNFYSRENLDFITGRPSLTHTMWVFFAPLGVQGDIRRVLNAAIEGEKE